MKNNFSERGRNTSPTENLKGRAVSDARGAIFAPPAGKPNPARENT